MSDDLSLFVFKSLGIAENGEVILLTLDSGGSDISWAIFHEKVPCLVLQLLRAAGQAMHERGDAALELSKPVSPFVVTAVQGGVTRDNDIVLSLTIEDARLDFLVPRSLKSPDGSFLVETLAEITQAGAALSRKEAN